MRILLVRFADAGADVTDGGSIFDRRLLEALRGLGADVEVEDVARKRALALPIWRTQIAPSTLERVRTAHTQGRVTVASHEALFTVAHKAPIDALIVHNYFPAFTFRGRPLLERYYRTGAQRFYRASFAATKCAFFISHREHRIALENFPALAGRTDICIPPPYPLPRSPRSGSVLHLSGNDAWFPKRLSTLTAEETDMIEQAGYRIADLDAPVAPAAALINDRFEVGFKLKLAQMLNCRDVIASFCDLSEEIAQLCPGNPFYRQVESVEEALAYFREIAERYSHDEIDAYYAEREASGYLPTWEAMAAQLLDLIARHTATTDARGRP